MFLSVIHEKISHLSTKQTTENNKNTLELRNETVNEELKLFHNKVGVVPIYKVSGNVPSVCRRHHAQVFINVLGLNNVNTITSTYMKAATPVEKIVSNNTSFQKNKYNIGVSEIDTKSS